MSASILSIVHAVYRHSAVTGDWLRGIVEASHSVLDRGLGVIAFTFDVSEPSRPRAFDFAASTTAAGAAEGLVRAADVIFPSSAINKFFHPFYPVRLLSDYGRGEDSAVYWPSLTQVGYADFVGVRGFDPDGHAILLGAGVGFGARGKLAPRTRHSLARVAAHLASGWRLRRALGTAALPDDADAVVTPRGSLEHASEDVRQRQAESSLVEAVVRREQAASLHLQPAQALELWQGLVDGRWSIVDYVDRDGKRLILARRNPPDVPEPSALTERERQVVAFAALGHSNKYVAYQLGLAPTTVATHLATAMRKLRVRSRRDLVVNRMASGAPRTSTR